ncbi:LLM class flavin-dependent oxidoreductase [Paracraurococcus ruber]|uniref:N5,N10-methylene tetrahydromethanopterin reductase n=1 Tax=Paracraurococcus ruber TaxID=77675 RepID=A0ABS1CYI8_9PROT|nr:LLM class flavin-dependent oxidoreductase [Paracraurococcus ruber]MBK1659390.1 N5,N10-methylene tetrahydromethanopterin reductase [Paracraurococcus ruber]TDG30483.1 LLM class flavin-dependent oxidoreductase [Paracraurococcus ruber]
MPKQLRLNAFDMACIGHIQQGMWTHPRDRSTDYKRLGYWTSLARTLERGLFDGLFLADVVGVYDVLGNSPDAAIHNAVQVPLLDPMLVVPAMAAVTQHLGFGVTVNLTYEAPALFARRFSTLDHLTDGRIGWNIVTGYLDSAARAMGMPAQQAHDARYDAAEQFMATAYALWESSWAADAVRADRAAGIYADPARVRTISSGGIEAVHLCEPSPQRTPVLYQAGASDRGREFAARHAECIFLNPSSPQNVARLVADLRSQAAPRPLRIFVGATLILGRTEAEARDLLEDYRRHASVEGALAHAAASLGIDFDRFGMDEPISASGSNAISSNVEAMARVFGPGWTKRNLVDRFILGSRQTPLVGTPDAIADQLVAFAEETGADGFNLSRTVMPECIDSVVDLLVPALQERGAYKTAYAPGTYRQKLFGAGPLLAAPHPAAEARG